MTTMNATLTVDEVAETMRFHSRQGDTVRPNRRLVYRLATTNESAFPAPIEPALPKAHWRWSADRVMEYIANRGDQ